jgi:hypothetical protein
MVAEDFDEIRSRMRVGSPVVANDSRTIGTVKELFGDGFRVDRPLNPDITLPYSAVETVNETGVLLNLPANLATAGSSLRDVVMPPPRVE